MRTEDEKHIILSVENVDREVRELRAANSAARKDSLTGVKNKLAYHELEYRKIGETYGLEEMGVDYGL